MTKHRFYDILKWDATVVGDEVAGNVAKRGWDDPMILGVRTIVTNKSYIRVIPGTLETPANNVTTFDDEILYYTAPEFIGKNYFIDKLHFYLEKKADVISWEMWKIVGMCIQNHKCVSMLRLGQ
jgi:hypothetical protein